MIVSLNYQRLYDIDKELEYNLHTKDKSDPFFTLNATEIIHYKAEGGIKALSPAYAIQITESLSIGFTLNFWMDAMGGRNGWKDEFRSLAEISITSPFFPDESIKDNLVISKEYDNARGFNYNLGILWNINEMITLGAVYKSEFESEMRRTIIAQSSQVRNGFEESTIELNFPFSYGAGLAFRLSDSFTVAFDAYRTEWGRYFFRDELDRKTSPIDGRPRRESHLKATNQVHLGAEYLFILEKTIIPVRGGVFL